MSPHPRQCGRPGFPGETQPDAAEEALVADPRAALTPADMVEHKLRGGMNGAPVRFSQLFTGLCGARGPPGGPGPAPGGLSGVEAAEGEAGAVTPRPRGGA